jgi:hypothetical protein
MQYSTKLKWFIVAFLAFMILARVGCYYAEKKYDTYRRPWAYSDDPAKPLLVGKWKGECKDADQVVHKVELEIFEPMSEDERWAKVFRKRGRRSRKSATFFDGMAVVETNGKRDTCEIWGGLDKADGHEIHFQISPVSEVHPPGFNINLLKGSWQENTLDLAVDFAFFRPDGGSFSDSADPRHDFKGRLVMARR